MGSNHLKNSADSAALVGCYTGLCVASISGTGLANSGLQAITGTFAGYIAYKSVNSKNYLVLAGQVAGSATGYNYFDVDGILPGAAAGGAVGYCATKIANYAISNASSLIALAVSRYR